MIPEFSYPNPIHLDGHPRLSILTVRIDIFSLVITNRSLSELVPNLSCYTMQSHMNKLRTPTCLWKKASDPSSKAPWSELKLREASMVEWLNIFYFKHFLCIHHITSYNFQLHPPLCSNSTIFLFITSLRRTRPTYIQQTRESTAKPSNTAALGA